MNVNSFIHIHVNEEEKQEVNVILMGLLTCGSYMREHVNFVNFLFGCFPVFFKRFD